MLSLNRLKSDIEALGIVKNDIVHMHSAMRALGPVEQGFNGVTQTFQDIIGIDGIFSIPTHSWSIVVENQPVYHKIFTPSNLGAYPNSVLARKDFKRSLHPTHSVASWGNRSDKFLEGDLTTPCPPNGSYSKLIDWNGKVVLLGVNLTRCTFFHVLEEISGCGDVWSLWEKKINVHIFDENDNRLTVEYRGHRDCKSENFYRIEMELIEAGILTQGFIGPAPVKVLDAKMAADWLVPKLKKDPKFFW